MGRETIISATMDGLSKLRVFVLLHIISHLAVTEKQKEKRGYRYQKRITLFKFITYELRTKGTQQLDLMALEYTQCVISSKNKQRIWTRSSVI